MSSIDQKKCLRFALYPTSFVSHNQRVKTFTPCAILFSLWQTIAVPQEPTAESEPDVAPVPQEVLDDIAKQMQDKKKVQLPPNDLLDKAIEKAEAGVDEFTAPRIALVFDSLKKLAPLPLADCKRVVPKRRPLDRADLAIEIGFLIADGFLIVQNNQMNEIEPLAKELSDYGKSLGAGEKVSRHIAGLLQSAKENNLEQLKKELSATQSDVEQELVSLRDNDLARLISLGGWLRALHVSASAVDKQFSKARAMELMRADVADYYTENLGSLHPDISQRPNIVQMREFLSDLRNIMVGDEKNPPTKNTVKEILKSAQELNRLASLRVEPK